MCEIINLKDRVKTKLINLPNEKRYDCHITFPELMLISNIFESNGWTLQIRKIVYAGNIKLPLSITLFLTKEEMEAIKW